MTRIKRNRSGSTARHMAVASKKNVAAVALLVIMGIMWVRVLTGGKPKSSAAETPAPKKEQTEKKASVDIRFVELPVVRGRNDNIYRDFFTVRDWKAFSKGSGSLSPTIDSEVHVVSPDWNQEVFARVAQKLKLEALSPPYAIINDRPLLVGDSISVKDGEDAYVFEVVRIDEDSVVVARKGHEVTLKLELTQSNDVSS